MSDLEAIRFTFELISGVDVRRGGTGHQVLGADKT
jgi:hypothetical protein